MKYFLCFGSNLGNRRRNLQKALNLLENKGIHIIQTSSVYETQPVDFSSQAWFLNQVGEVKSGFNPEKLLSKIQEIETEMGRKPSIPKGPRIIDIDILMAEDRIIQTEDLKIPHPRLDKRNFVLFPFAEISPQTIHPVFKKTIRRLAQECTDPAVIQPYHPEQ